VRIARAVHGILTQAGLPSRLRETSIAGDAELIAADAIADHTGDALCCVVACGGDGTVQEVANALAKCNSDRAVLGLAPAGRCNDFARALGITTRPLDIASALADGVMQPVDLGRIGERYFCTVAAMGFDAAVSRYVDQSKVPIRGTLAYVHGTLRVLRRFETPTLRLSGEFGDYEGPAFLAATANTPWYGGAMKIAPAADAFDGQADICLVTDIARWKVMTLLPQVILGRHADRPEVRMWRTRTLTASPTDGGRDIEIWADGEPVTNLPATVTIEPSAIKVLLPRPPTS